MTDDIKILSVDTADRKEWLVSGEYARPDKIGSFQAHARSLSVIALLVGAQKMNWTVRVTWKDGRSKGFRDVLLAQVID